MCDLFLKALTELQDSKGTLDDIFTKMIALDKNNAQSLLVLDLLLLYEEFKTKGLVKSTYNPKLKSDIIELVKQEV
jgi:hypothetical protein